MQKGVKKRVTYEEIFNARRAEIDQMNLKDIDSCRSRLKAWKDNVDIYINAEGIQAGRRMYLLGLRKHVIQKLLTHSKKRKAYLNRIIYNGINIELALRFVRVAMKELPIAVFKNILTIASKDKQSEEAMLDAMRKSSDE